MYEQNNVEFTGVLVDRQYATGQKYVQLVFETAEGIRLSLSRNVNMVRSLTLGSTYKVQGSERTVGQKRYIHEPTAIPVSPGGLSLLSKHRKVIIAAAISLAVVLSGVGVLAYATRNSDTSSTPTTNMKKTTSKSTPVTSPSTTTDSGQALNAIPSDSAQEQDDMTPVQPNRKSTPTSSAPVITSPLTNNPVTTPVIDGTTNPPITQEETAPITSEPITENPETPLPGGTTEPDSPIIP
jgi:hypothetical protein